MHPILHFGNFPDLAFALLGATIALAVLLARPKDPANLYFAAFMGFLVWGTVAGVYYINANEDLARLQLSQTASPEQLSAAAERLALHQRLFWIPYLFDPITLLYFASVYPRRNRLHRPAVLLPFAAAALALLAIDVFSPMHIGEVTFGEHVGPLSTPMMHVVLAMYMLGAYSLALWGLLELLWSGGVTQQRARLLLIGLGIAVFARVGLFLEEWQDMAALFQIPPVGSWELVAYRVAQMAIALVFAYGFYALALRRSPGQAIPMVRQARNVTMLGIVALAGTIWLLAPVASLAGVRIWDVGAPVFPFAVVERMRYSARWVVFGGVVGYSILRFQLFDLSWRARRAVMHAGLLAALVGAFGMLAFLMSGTLATMRADLLLVAAVAASLVILQAYDASKRRLGRHLREPDAGEVRLRKMEVYRAAVESAPENAEQLADLRTKLNLTDEEARTVELLARAPRAGGPLAVGATVGGRYVVERLLGRGGGGRVFLARDTLLDRLVVLKEIEAEEHADLSRALAEAKHAGGLSHPNVVVVFDTLLWGHRQLLVMEYLPGGSLDQELRERGALPGAHAARAMRGILGGLAAVHARGIVHGDVKPANVLLSAEGAPKLADFGISSLQRSSTLPAAGAHGLTLRYAAPEVLAGGRPTARSDVYSAALVFVDLLVGVESSAPLPQRLQQACARLPVAAAAALRRAVETDPQRRHADAAEFLGALEPVLAAQSVQ